VKKKQNPVNEKELVTSVMLHRDMILQKIAPNHDETKVRDVANKIEKFLQESFPNTSMGTIALAMQWTTDKVILGMLDVQ